MCELMGMSFARPVSADFSIREFALRGQENADGWGLAWYPDRSVAVVKEPVEWRASQYTGFLETYPQLQAHLYIAHVRHKTTGGAPTHSDTHPFWRELAGTAYCFAHNGTIERHTALPLGRFRPLGNTDSEHVFCHLLAEVGERPQRLEQEADWRWLQDLLARLNQQGKLNCLLADGRRLFCYHDANGYKGLTFRRVVLRDNAPRSFGDQTLQIDLEGEGINAGLVVATQPLSRSGWHRFQPGELLVLEEGRVRYSSHRDPQALVFRKDSDRR